MKALVIGGTRLMCRHLVGEDDYTNRLFFYVEHIMAQIPCGLTILNIRWPGFLSFFAQNNFCGGINGASGGTISIQDVAGYVKR